MEFVLEKHNYSVFPLQTCLNGYKRLRNISADCMPASEYCIRCSDGQCCKTFVNLFDKVEPFLSKRLSARAPLPCSVSEVNPVLKLREGRRSEFVLDHHDFDESASSNAALLFCKQKTQQQILTQHMQQDIRIFCAYKSVKCEVKLWNRTPLCMLMCCLQLQLCPSPAPTALV